MSTQPAVLAAASVFAATAFVVATAAQGASGVPYGSGCNGLVLATNAPVFGTHWNLTTTGVHPLSPFAIDFFGTAPVNVPLSLLGIPAPGCNVHIDTVLASQTAVNVGGTAVSAVPIPSDPLLLGAVLTVQSLGLTTANPSFLATSNGVEGTVGTPSDFVDLAFSNRSVLVDYGSPYPPQTVVLDGTVTVDPSGFANGTLTATFADSTTATVTYGGDDVVIAYGATTLDLDIAGAGDMVLVNGVATPIDAVVGAFLAHMLGGGAPGTWSAAASGAVLALAAIHETPEMANNFVQARALATDAAGWFCKTLGVTFAAAATTLVFTGCNALVLACGAAATITIGGSVIACAEAIVACTNGLWATPALAYVWYVTQVWSI